MLPWAAAVTTCTGTRLSGQKNQAAAAAATRHFPDRFQNGLRDVGCPPDRDVSLEMVPLDGPAAQRYDARPGTCYLLRPDQHVAARWRRFDPAAVRSALCRALALQ